ncbi:MAG: lipid A export permease/ATP-binding protein MsbA [Nitrospira sp.]|nr:lipid A export permease/ATP-binding protein MsbA [Nitrospira sp.]
MTAFFRILSYLREYRVRLIAACICAAGVAGMSGLYALLVQPVLDEVFIAKDQLLLMVLPLVIFGAATLKGLFSYGQAYLMSYVANRVVAEIRQQLFGHFLRMSLPFHHKHSSGRLVARVINDVNEMANAIPHVVRDLLQQGLTLLALTGVAFYQNWKLATALILVMPISTYAIVKIGKRLRKLAARGQESMGDMASALKESFAGIRIVKAYGGEHLEQQRFAKGNSAYLRTVMKSAQLGALSAPLLEAIGIGGIAFIVWYGGFLVIDEQMKPGEFFSFLAAMFIAYTPVKKLAGANSQVQRAIAAANRVFEMLDQEHEFVHDHGRAELPAISRSLEFQNVSFSYEGSDEPEIEHVHLTVEFGEVVALVGKSGSGKSTLMSLVPRFHDPSEGRILIDGRDIRDVTLTSLRAQIAIVSQETVLFDETVRANVAYGRPEASEEDIIRAARAGHAWEFIEELPDGLDTLIGENGVNLSGGQRQRLAIARAMLRNPPVLILDEATSALDTESERNVQAALAELMKNRTTLVIAHRLSTVQHADRIIVLDEGRIVEEGLHHELLRRNGMYTRLYQTQFHDVPATHTVR